MNQAVLLADIGNVGLLVSAALTTVSVAAYAVQARGGEHGAWWRSPFGVHLMCFMAAFAVVLGQGVIYLLTSTGLFVPASALLPRPDWFAWMRVISFCALIPPVLGWRLWIIIRPPRSLFAETPAAPGSRRGLSVCAETGRDLAGAQLRDLPPEEAERGLYQIRRQREPGPSAVIVLTPQRCRVPKPRATRLIAGAASDPAAHHTLT